VVALVMTSPPGNGRTSIVELSSATVRQIY
jgi:hypothetical protein